MQLLGIKRRQLDEYRAAIGGEFEHKAGNSKSAPVYIDAPPWLAAWANARASTSHSTRIITPGYIDHADRLKCAQADKAELELARVRGHVVSADAVKADYDQVAGKIRDGIELVGTLSRECQEIMIDKLKEAEAVFSDNDRLPKNSGSGRQRANGQA